MMPQSEISLAYGVANIATGLFVFVLLPLYFFNTAIRYREKLATGALLAVLYCGLNYNPLDFVFNGGHFPNQLPGRWSFAFSLAVVTVAANGIAKANGIKLKTVISSLIAGAAFLSLGEYSKLSEVKEEYLSVWILWMALFCALLTVYIVSLAHTGKSAWRIVSGVCCVLLALVIMLETASNAISVASEINGGIGVSSISHYNNAMGLFTKYGEQYDSGDDTFYRTETNEGWTFDDGQLGGFKSISYYGSTMNGRVFRLLRYMGNRVYTQNISSLYNNSSPVQNSLFGIRYFIDRGRYLNERLWGVNTVADNSDALIWENSTAFPLAFASSDEIRTITIDDDERMKDEIRAITAQNEFINKLYGSALNVFEAQSCIHSYENCELTPSDDWFNSNYHAVNAALPTTFTYTYVCQDERPVYFEQNFKNGTMTVKVNDKESDVDMLTEPFKYVGSYPAGTVITVTVRVQNGNGKYGLDFFVLDPERLQTAYEAFATSGLEVTSFKTTRVEGTMTTGDDTVVFTSIPQDNGWSVYVDGKKTETYLIADALVGFDLPAGTHTVVFRYLVPGLAIGAIGSVVALIALAFCLFWRRYRLLHPAPPKPEKVKKPVAEISPAVESQVMKPDDDLEEIQEDLPTPVPAE